MKGLYSNIGKKLMTFAIVIAVIFTIFGVIAGLAVMTTSIATGIIFIILYPLLGYISSLSIYAFGRITQSVENIEKTIVKDNEEQAVTNEIIGE